MTKPFYEHIILKYQVIEKIFYVYIKNENQYLIPLVYLEEEVLKIDLENRLKKIGEILKSKKIKFTHQRREIVKLIINEKKHLKAEDIYDNLRKEGIGLATIYRNLELLKSEGILKEINHGKYRYYEMKAFGLKSMHMHFKCEKCGKIIDIENKNMIFEIERFKDIIESEYEVDIQDTSYIFSGICKNCLK